MPKGKRSICLSRFSNYASEKDDGRQVNLPLMPAAIKLWAGQLLLELIPTVKFPVKDLEVLDIVTQVRQVFGSESFICRTGSGEGNT